MTSTFLGVYLCSMSSTEERKVRAASRKPQLNLELHPGEKELFERIAKKRGVKVAALIRLLVLDEGRRLGIE
jgi:hypothetical protein